MVIIASPFKDELKVFMEREYHNLISSICGEFEREKDDFRKKIKLILKKVQKKKMMQDPLSRLSDSLSLRISTKSAGLASITHQFLP